MLKFLIGLANVIAVATVVYAKNSPASQTRLPYIADSQFSPEVYSVLYGSKPEHYESLIQFFGSDAKHVTGRYCKLDDNSMPFDCVGLTPDDSSNSCSVTAYKATSLPINALELDQKSVEQVLFDNFVKDPLEKRAAHRALPKVGFAKVGSARTNVPANLKVRNEYDISVPKAQFDKNRGQPNAELIYMTNLACHNYFEVGGAMEKFSSARASSAQRCELFNRSASRRSSSSGIEDCKEAQNHSAKALTIAERAKSLSYTTFIDANAPAAPQRQRKGSEAKR